MNSEALDYFCRESKSYMMSTFLLILHSLLRWVVLLAGFWAVWRAFSGLGGKKAYSAPDNRSGLFFTISCDLQFLIGILLYFLNGWAAKWTGGHLQQVMSNPVDRFYTVEHISMMVLAWILVHIGRVVVRKGKSDKDKFSKSLIYFGVALLLILLAIPWPFRDAGRPLLPHLNILLGSL